MQVQNVDQWPHPTTVLIVIILLVLGIVFADTHFRSSSPTQQKASTTASSSVSAPQPTQGSASSPPVSELKVQLGGPCEDMPGTEQVVANVCDDGNGSFFVRLNPNDYPGTRIAHIMERIRSYRLDFLNRRILSVVPVTDTVCFNNSCSVVMHGAYVRYEFIK